VIIVIIIVNIKTLIFKRFIIKKINLRYFYIIDKRKGLNIIIKREGFILIASVSKANDSY
jgi:hypothetical protein